MNLRVIAAAICTALLAVGVAACGDNNDSTTATDMSTDEASVSFTSPTEGATEGDSVIANVDLKNFELDAANVGKAALEGKGHVHFSMDNGKFDQPKYSGANGDLAKQLGVNGKYSPSVEPTVTYKGLPKGEHTLTVFLANNDHSDAGPKDTVNFTVE